MSDVLTFAAESAWHAEKRPRSYLDVFSCWAVRLLSIGGVIALITLLLAPKFLLPAEDAVILYNYSHNLAHTGAISFISNGPHAEGATDFGWMVFLALGARIGMDPFWLVAITNAFCLVALAAVLLTIAGRPSSSPVWRRPAALGSLLSIAGVFALIPQFYAAAAGFSVLPFSCLLALLALSFLRRNDVATPVVGLLLCLFRPDGIVFSVPLLMAALLCYPGRLRRLTLDIVLFAFPGALYFLWRWHYFSELLPLPFLVKSNVHRIAHLFVMSSVQAAMPYCIIALFLLWLALRGRMSDTGNRIILLTLVVLPNLFYFAMRLDQNFGDRFFIYLPVGTAVLLAMNWNHLRPPIMLGVGCLLWVVLIRGLMLGDARDFWFAQFDTRKAIAQDLAKFPHGVMIVTEAGIVPFYSHWTAYDAWGLNTAQFAKRLFQPSDVAAIRPDLMLVHSPDDLDCQAHSDWQTPYTDRTWTNLTRNIMTGAAAARYTVWVAPFGNSRLHPGHVNAPSPEHHECWYVSRDSPIGGQIADVLVRHGAISGREFSLKASTR